ncbi:MAG: cbb3-type cytochrome c oxidase subunit I [Xanthomonadales bacterium]|nr:cbb3-type cytochrome c oxidase subunit I [Xanthomonadales bacterium]
MKNIDRWFILTGLVFLLTGMALGLHMSKAQDFTLHGLHAHLNLLGFVVMTLFGLCYRTWPKMQEGILATVHYLLHTVTVATALTLLFFMLSNMDLAPKLGPILDTVLLGTVAGVVLFFYLFFTRARE